MKKEDILNLIGKKVRMILENDYRYSGKLINCDDDTLNLLDKFERNVFIKLKTIILFEEMKNG